MRGRIYLAAEFLIFVATVSSSQAQDPELFLESYPNAQISVDGDAGDWNLSQFGTVVVGGMNPGFSFGDEMDWVRETGTGDIALIGFDDEVDTTVYYGGRWTGASFPENPMDFSAKIYARDNATHQYFLVDVTDDEVNTVNSETDHHLPQHTHPNGAAWANDSVEFYIAPEDNIDPVDWESDVQLVIDAGNQVQVWNSSPAYIAQVEAGVTSAVTMTDTGYMIEVGIDKSVFATPLPAVLGDALDPDGNNYGIDISFRDNDDPNGTGNLGGDTLHTTAWDWADPTSGGGFPSKTPSLWGQMIVGVASGLACDFDSDGDCDQGDIDTLYATSPSAADINDWLSQASDPANTALGSPTDTLVLGDIDLSGEVTSADLGLLLNNFGTNASTWMAGDLNASGGVDSADLGLLLNNFGFASSAASAVPEPNAIALLGLGVLGLLAVRRRS